MFCGVDGTDRTAVGDGERNDDGTAETDRSRRAGLRYELPDAPGDAGQ
ncbi:hypothetical protein [Halorientalis pallida]|nr:hypothetical protein [Halorientalis pallida]